MYELRAPVSTKPNQYTLVTHLHHSKKPAQEGDNR